MGRLLTLRVSQAEFDFLDRLAREKSTTRTAVARHLLLQNLALDAIKTEVKAEVASVLSAELAEVIRQIVQSRLEGREDLTKSTLFLRDEIQKSGGKK